MTNTIEQLEKQVNYAGPIWTNEDELEFYLNYTPNHYYYLDENDDFFYYIDYFEDELEEIRLEFGWGDSNLSLKDMIELESQIQENIRMTELYYWYELDQIDQRYYGILEIPEEELEELQSEEYHLDLFERYMTREEMWEEWYIRNNPIEWCLSELDIIDYEFDIPEHELEEICYNLQVYPHIFFRFGYYRNYDD